MNFKMHSSLFLLLCTLGVVFAYRLEAFEPLEGAQPDHLDESAFAYDDDVNVFVAPDVGLSRVRRQLQLQGGGGGSPGKGFDLSLNGRAPVWTSGNGRHSFDVTGGYSQHLGGPYGNSRPNLSGGGVYTFRF